MSVLECFLAALLAGITGFAIGAQRWRKRSPVFHESSWKGDAVTVSIGCITDSPNGTRVQLETSHRYIHLAPARARAYAVLLTSMADDVDEWVREHGSGAVASKPAKARKLALVKPDSEVS